MKTQAVSSAAFAPALMTSKGPRPPPPGAPGQPVERSSVFSVSRACGHHRRSAAVQCITAAGKLIYSAATTWGNSMGFPLLTQDPWNLQTFPFFFSGGVILLPGDSLGSQSFFKVHKSLACSRKYQQRNCTQPRQTSALRYFTSLAMPGGFSGYLCAPGFSGGHLTFLGVFDPSGSGMIKLSFSKRCTEVQVPRRLENEYV